MGKMRYLVIEDSVLMRHFKRDLPNDSSFFCRTYEDAQRTINQLELASDEDLCVILDHDLNDPSGSCGVDLFFQIREKFPEAYIINFSSDPKNFLKAVNSQYLSQVRDFGDREKIFTFDDTADNKSPNDAIARAMRYQKQRSAAADKDCCCSFFSCFKNRRKIRLDYKGSHSASTSTSTSTSAASLTMERK
ncbi:MAG: hypothetical protein KBD83_05820 [Gammaproteobacteria bacterium]|nr:hypothetical protein [Gammaproteobacteria bacterium]